MSFLCLLVLLLTFVKIVLSRSFRRESASEEISREVTDSVVNCNNRWIKEESAGGRKGKLKIRYHYSEVLISL